MPCNSLILNNRFLDGSAGKVAELDIFSGYDRNYINYRMQTITDR